MFLLLPFLLFSQSVVAVDPIAKLSYTSYEGTVLNNNVTQWLGIRYAAPPVGDLRFSAPQDPLKRTAVQQADAHGPLCLGTNAGGPDNTSSEDCLFLDVYSPSNAKSGSLPVYVFIQGGGFNSLGNANYNGSGLIKASGGNIVVVNFNYRVGPYGFLASQEVQKGGSINNGLKDQRKVLEWVQKYISKFGGNPKHVVLGGDSAGAASVNLQLTAYGGRDDKLFHATAAESQSFAAIRDVSGCQYQYDTLVIRTGCSNATNTLACLRGINATFLQQKNFNIPFPGAELPPLYMYGPVLDNDFIKEYTYAAYEKGNFVKLPAIYGDDTNEGTVFTPRTTNNLSDSNTFLRDQFPDLTLQQLATINSLYPVAEQFAGAGSYWRQAANAYGEIRYICPGVFISNTYASMNLKSNWNYHWNVIDPPAAEAGYGIVHTVEVTAIWGPENVNGRAPASYSTTNAAIVPVVQAYWTSFIRSFDPNTYRLSGTPKWENWTKNGYQRLRFQTNNTQMEVVPTDQRKRCAYLSSIGVALKQ